MNTLISAVYIKHCPGGGELARKTKTTPSGSPIIPQKEGNYLENQTKNAILLSSIKRKEKKSLSAANQAHQILSILQK